MPEATDSIHICDDWITAELPDLQIIHRICRKMRAEGPWTEVVGGLQSIAVKFDPAMVDPNDAFALFAKQIESPASNEVPDFPNIQIPVCYHSEFGLDCEWIAEQLGIKPQDLAEWHSSFEFSVAMLGFMPGFGYLQTEDAIPEIGRLPRPRRNVAAGSIGIIGRQSCVYSFDSPGGWPIIGRTPVSLFDINIRAPALLNPGQIVHFIAISRSEFEEAS